MTSTPAADPYRSILILKSNPMALQSSEQFLRSRGWNIHSVTGLVEAVQILFGKKVGYFLICANHPQKKVKAFPRLLSQFQGLRVIAYTDIANVLNMTILQEMEVPHQILPPVSGPAIERMIYRIEKEVAQQKNAEDKAAQQKGFMDDLANISVWKQAAEKMTYYFNNDSDEAPPYMDLNPNEANNSFNGFGTETFSEYEERMRRQQAGMFIDKGEKKESGPSFIHFRKDEIPAKKNAKPPLQKSPPAFQEGVEHALKAAISPLADNNAIPAKKIEIIRDCICLNVESSYFRGYLVAAMGQNRRFDDEFIATVQNRLQEFLKGKNLETGDNNPLEITIRPVDFEGWAIEKAEFLRKTIHNGNEVAVAFFPVEKTIPNFGQSQALDMVSFDIEDLATDVPVTFDVYIYLPANNKYILYTPKGGTFLAHQKDRLKSKGVHKMHTKKSSTSDVTKYHIENNLNNSIQEFEEDEQNKRKKASSE